MAQEDVQLIGMTLNRRYLIEKEIGRGGIGVVYLARDRQLLSKPVVVKVLLEKAEQETWFRKKFRQEMEALARIDHPGVIGVLDAGEMPDGRPFLVMQYVEGASLRPALRVEGMDFARVANILRQIGQALNAAHEKGVYHRDLKPENIMLQTVGEGEEYAKLIDFGIAMVSHSQVSPGQDSTKAAGTPSYMAPEQHLGQATAASDIYSLGVIAYEMLTGQFPFDARTLVQLYEMQRQGRITPPRQHRYSLSEEAAAILVKALSFHPEDRYARARDFTESLALALASGAKAAARTVEATTAIGLSASKPADIPNLGHVVPKLCNRRPQAHEFANHFIANLKQRRGLPQVYIVHGEEKQCHDSMIERLVNTHIRQSAEKIWGEQKGVVAFRKLDWAYEGEPFDLEMELKRILFAEFDPVYMEDDMSATALSKLAALALTSIVAIQHTIHATRWGRPTGQLIEWYRRYWADMQVHPSRPQFIIFLAVIYPRGRTPGGWMNWLNLKRFDKKRVQGELQQIVSAPDAKCPCVLLSELAPVRQEHVKDWFSINNFHSEKMRYELVEKIFGGADSRSMADVEHELETLVRSLQEGLSKTRGYL